MQEASNPSPDNPYATPSSVGSLPARNLFQDIHTTELKKLRNDSHTIRAVAALLILGLLGMFLAGGLMISASFGNGGGPGIFELLFILMLGALNSVVIVGLMARANWGRILGFISGVFMLLGFPIGTLIGVLFMISLGRGKRLFGPDRLVHKQLEAEWKYRKRNKVE